MLGGRFKIYLVYPDAKTTYCLELISSSKDLIGDVGLGPDAEQMHILDLLYKFFLTYSPS